MGSENKVVIILANHDFQDVEYSETAEAIRSAGIDVAIAAAVNEECKGIQGLEVSVDLALDEVDANQFDAIVVIGGVGVEAYLHDEAVHSLLKAFKDANKIVAAICWAPSVLANAGVLLGKKATVWSGAIDDLISNGAQYTAEPVTVDGKIVTANGPDSASRFGMTVAKMIAG